MRVTVPLQWQYPFSIVHTLRATLSAFDTRLGSDGKWETKRNEDRLKRSETDNLIQPRLFSSRPYPDLQSGTKVIETIPEYKSSPFKCNLFYLHSSYFASPPSQCYNHVTASTKPVSTSMVGWVGGGYWRKRCFFYQGKYGFRKRPRFTETSQHFVSDCSLSMLNQKK